MALVTLLSDLLDDYRRPSLSDLLADQLLTPSSALLRAPPQRSVLRPWRRLSAPSDSGGGLSTIQNDKSEFRINLDVQQFKPEELKVSVADGFIVVDGKHEERCDEHGFVSRQFTRKYKIPKDVDEASLTSSLSSDGVLALKARKRLRPGEKSKAIPITFTNEPAVKRTKIENSHHNGSGEIMEQ